MSSKSMKKYFLKFLSIGFLLILPVMSFAQATPIVAFDTTPTVAVNNIGESVSVSLAGRVVLGGGAQIEDAVVSVAYSTSPLDASYAGSYQEIFSGSADPLDSDFDSNQNFFEIISGFNTGQTYYFLFRTGVNIEPVPTGFSPDIRAVEITIPASQGGGGVINPPCGGELQPPCGGPAEVIPWTTTTTIVNPLGVDFDIINFFNQLFKNFVKIALPFLVIFTIYSGFLFVAARGNEEKLSEAKKNFLYVIIGAALVFGSWTIAHVLKGTVDQFEAYNFIIKLLV